MTEKISTGLMQINHEELSQILDHYYKTKLFLMIYGTFGIGKSRVIKEKAEKIAKKKNKEFIEWNRLTKKEKLDTIKNPGKKFVFIDERLSTYDASDVRGLPNFDSDETIDWKIPLWAKMVTTKDSDGFLFFDEANLAIPLVISSIYQVVLDRVVGNTKIEDNWLILGAGNVDEDRASTFELPPPIKDRGGEVVLNIPDYKVWSTWAVDNRIDSRIISFLAWKNNYLHNVDYDKMNKHTTPRGWERLSKLLEETSSTEEIELISKTAIGQHIASEFSSYVRIKDRIDINKYLNDPSKIEEINTSGEGKSLLYFITGTMAEIYGKGEMDFNKIVGFLKAFDNMGLQEFSVILLKLCKQYDIKRFSKDWGECNEDIMKKFVSLFFG